MPVKRRIKRTVLRKVKAHSFATKRKVKRVAKKHKGAAIVVGASSAGALGAHEAGRRRGKKQGIKKGVTAGYAYGHYAGKRGKKSAVSYKVRKRKPAKRR